MVLTQPLKCQPDFAATLGSCWPDSVTVLYLPHPVVSPVTSQLLSLRVGHGVLPMVTTVQLWYRRSFSLLVIIPVAIVTVQLLNHEVIKLLLPD